MIKWDDSIPPIVEWLTDNKSSIGLIGPNQGISYLIANDAAMSLPPKHGMSDKVANEGMDPVVAAKIRYKSKAGFFVNPRVVAVWVWDKDPNQHEPFDDRCRRRMVDKRNSGDITFSANVRKIQTENSNNEALIDFKITDLPELTKIIAEVAGFTGSTLAAFVPRYGQQENIDRVFEILQKYHRAVMASYTGSGKSAKALKVLARMLPNGGFCLLTCPVKETLDSFRKDASTRQFTESSHVRMHFFDANDLRRMSIKKLKATADAGDIVIIALTVQDLTYDDGGNRDIRLKYAALSGMLNFWIRDEYHLYYGGIKTQPRLLKMASDYILDVTATPYRFLNEVEPDQIAAQTLLWALRDPKTGVPRIQIDAIGEALCKIPKAYEALFSVTEGYTPAKMVLREFGAWTYQSALIDLVMAFYHNPLSREKNPLSIINDTTLCTMAKVVGMWVFPGGEASDTAEMRLRDMAALYNAETNGRGRLYISSYEIEEQRQTKGMTVGQYVDYLVTVHGNVTILTCRKFTTGTDIPQLGHIILMAGFEGLGAFEQLLGRMIRILKGKTNTKIYCMAPGRSVKLMVYMLAKAQEKLDPSHTTREYVDCLPITEYRGGFRSVNVEDVMEIGRLEASDGLRTRVSADPIYAALESIMGGFPDAEIADFLQIGYGTRKATKVKLTDDNGAKNYKPRLNPKTNQPNTKQQQSRLEMLMEVVQSITQDLMASAYTTKCYDLKKLLAKNDFLESLFGTRLDTYRALLKHRALWNVVQRKLDTQNEAFGTASVKDIYAIGAVFINTEFKTKKGLVYTPFEAAETLLRKLPAKNPKSICVVNALNGIFPLLLQQKYPNAKITCVECYSHFHLSLKAMGFDVTDMNGVKNMHFDAMVGNPPYQDGTGKSSSKLWKQIIVESIEHLAPGGYLALVTPPSWMSPGELFDTMSQYDIPWVSLDVDKHFNVGSQFSAWVLHKVPSTGQTTFVMPGGSELKVDWNGMPFLPAKMSALTIELTKRMLGRKTFEFIATNENSSIKPHVSKVKTKTFRWNVMHTNVQTLWSSQKPSNYDTPKVMITRSGSPEPVYSRSSGTSQIGFYNVVADDMEGKRLTDILSSKTYQVLLNSVWKYSGWNKLSVLRYLPALDLTRDWTDADIYKHFKLTKDEIAYIEANYKAPKERK